MITQYELTSLHDIVEHHKETALEAFQKHPNIDYVDLVYAHSNNKFYNLRYTAKEIITIGYTLVTEISSDDYLDTMNEYDED